MTDRTAEYSADQAARLDDPNSTVNAPRAVGGASADDTVLDAVAQGALLSMEIIAAPNGAGADASGVNVGRH